MKIAQTGSQDGVDFEGNYTVEEINEYVNTMKKLFVVRDVVLKVNTEYIRLRRSGQCLPHGTTLPAPGLVQKYEPHRAPASCP